MSLLNALNESYISHPAFSNFESSLVADSDQVELVNRMWLDFLDGRSTPTAALLRDSIESIFRSLGRQSVDPLLNQFLSELCDLTVNQFLSDFKFLSAGLPDASPRLRDDRYFFTELPVQTVAKILRTMSRFLQSARSAAAAGETRRDVLSINHGRDIRKVVRLLDRDFRKLGVLDDVSTILPRRARVVGVAFELSVPTSTWWRDSLGLGPKTLYAHFDESITAPKAIVYLSEVHAENGPTSCFPHIYEELALSPLQDAVGRIVGTVGNKADSPLLAAYGKTYHQSMSSPLFRAHFMALPTSLRFNSHFGWDVLPSSEVEARVASREVVMTGPPGTAIVFDGARLLHRGGLIDSGERVVLQVIFGTRTPVQTIGLVLRKGKSVLASLLKTRSK